MTSINIIKEGGCFVWGREVSCVISGRVSCLIWVIIDQH